MTAALGLAATGCTVGAGSPGLATGTNLPLGLTQVSVPKPVFNAATPR